MVEYWRHLRDLDSNRSCSVNGLDVLESAQAASEGTHACHPNEDLYSSVAGEPAILVSLT